MLEAQFRALGAIPQVMAFSDVYQALQTGVVDGQENTPVEHLHPEDARGAEVRHRHQSRLYRLRRGREQEVLGRPAGGHPRPLEKAMKEATDYGNDDRRKENEDALAEIKKTGKTEIFTLTPEQDEACARR